MLQQIRDFLDLLESFPWVVQDQSLESLLQMSEEIISSSWLGALQKGLQVVVLLHVSSTSFQIDEEKESNLPAAVDIIFAVI